MKQNYIQEQNFLKDEVPPQRTVNLQVLKMKRNFIHCENFRYVVCNGWLEQIYPVDILLLDALLCHIW